MFDTSRKRNYIHFLLFFVFYLPLFAQNQEIVLSRFEPGEIKFAGFTLNSDKSVSIKAVGAGADKVVRRTKNNVVDPQNQFAYAWIIDARTRELKWRMTPQNTESDWWGAKYNRTFNGTVSLKKGEYEIYYAAFHPVFLATEDGYFSLKKIWGKVFGDEDWWVENSAEWKVTLSNVDEVFEQSAVVKYQRAVKKSAIVDLTDIRDSQELKMGFTLKKPALLQIYALGEGFESEMYDFVYIIDANTRKRIWTMDERKSQYAGGALKNRMIRQEIEFDAGNYLVYYQSDDSHSSGNWNANPPYDPNFWGVTVTGVGGRV
ncbi:MAG: hypothetical protein E4H13_03330 [Calditrichales bacterium]|nr:MAG: hypothetical protein E4H13_03330 [Calditrichales bacterium]